MPKKGQSPAEELLTAYLREWPTLTIEEARRELGLDDDAEDAGGAAVE